MEFQAERKYRHISLQTGVVKSRAFGTSPSVHFLWIEARNRSEEDRGDADGADQCFAVLYSGVCA